MVDRPLSNPVTEVGRVVYNAKRDSVDLRKRRRDRGYNLYPQDHPANKHTNAAEAFSVHKHDLCLMYERPSKRRTGLSNDTDVHVFSSANNMKTDCTHDKIQQVRKQLTFGGIASNPARFDETNTHNEQGFASQFGGLTTIVNTGPETIKAGDFVMWDIPSADALPDTYGKWKHAPKGKALFLTLPYTYGVEKIEVEQEIQQCAGDVEKICNVFRTRSKENTRRVFGRAMSTAKPNASFDILLGNYCA
jgi:hypothetical protein